MYEAFYYIHIILTLGILGAGLIHGIGVAAAGYILLAIDILIRVFFFVKYKHLTQSVAVRGSSHGITTLEWPKSSFKYQPG